MKLHGWLRAILLLILLGLQGAGSRTLAQSSSPYAEVRVTTGSYRVAGWERQLVKGNPNLVRYTWVPITGYIQGKARVRQPSGSSICLAGHPTQPRKPIYVTPIHVPTVVLPHGQAPDETQLRCTIKVPNLSLAAKDVSAKLAYGDTCREVSAELKDKPKVLVYPNAYGSQDRKEVQVLLERKHVFGKINRLNF